MGSDRAMHWSGLDLTGDLLFNFDILDLDIPRRLIIARLNWHINPNDILLQVAWIKSDTKAILAIHDHVITNNDRLAITHNDKVRPHTSPVTLSHCHTVTLSGHLDPDSEECSDLRPRSLHVPGELHPSEEPGCPPWGCNPSSDWRRPVQQRCGRAGGRLC